MYVDPVIPGYGRGIAVTPSDTLALGEDAFKVPLAADGVKFVVAPDGNQNWSQTLATANQQSVPGDLPFAVTGNSQAMYFKPKASTRYIIRISFDDTALSALEFRSWEGIYDLASDSYYRIGGFSGLPNDWVSLHNIAEENATLTAGSRSIWGTGDNISTYIHTENLSLTPAEEEDGYYASALYVGGTGNVKIRDYDDNEVTLQGVTAGTILPIYTRQVFKTGTTATHIVALVPPIQSDGNEIGRNLTR